MTFEPIICLTQYSTHTHGSPDPFPQDFICALTVLLSNMGGELGLPLDCRDRMKK